MRSEAKTGKTGACDQKLKISIQSCMKKQLSLADALQEWEGVLFLFGLEVRLPPPLPVTAVLQFTEGCTRYQYQDIVQQEAARTQNICHLPLTFPLYQFYFLAAFFSDTDYIDRKVGKGMFKCAVTNFERRKKSSIGGVACFDKEEETNHLVETRCHDNGHKVSPHCFFIRKRPLENRSSMITHKNGAASCVKDCSHQTTV
ncbi:hypothetical protein CDAR_532691 [Caerostris darwini]|uniref:Uncharacterized protein n=1 Tax=Caerostris darwini TaxID=1538125 RepID=A0AAV4VYF3_9ARAC|nr:hypothetical protein CDAR_532691 [Caerostris darwini]